jgi:hypothetical protein
VSFDGNAFVMSRNKTDRSTPLWGNDGSSSSGTHFSTPALALRLLQKTARHADFSDLEYGTIAEACG